MFLKNKYNHWYYNIIYKAHARLENYSYTERHHIIPKSLGGSNKKENIVVLTAREHFICHILLTKMTEGQNRIKMVHAAVGMKRARNYQERYINARLYAKLKEEFALISSQRNLGKKASKETCKKLSKASKGKPKSKEHAVNISKGLTGYKRGPMPESEKLKRSIAAKGKPSHLKGKKSGQIYSEERRANIAESNRRRGVSEETKAKIAATLKAKNETKRVHNLLISIFAYSHRQHYLILN
jgi:hypothetical protein